MVANEYGLAKIISSGFRAIQNSMVVKVNAGKCERESSKSGYTSKNI